VSNTSQAHLAELKDVELLTRGLHDIVSVWARRGIMVEARQNLSYLRRRSMQVGETVAILRHIEELKGILTHVDP